MVALLEIIFEPLAEIVLGLIAVGVAWFFGTIAYSVWGQGRAIADSPRSTPVVGRGLFGRSEGGHLTPDRQLDAYDAFAIIVTPLLCGLVILAFMHFVTAQLHQLLAQTNSYYSFLSTETLNFL